ncbi:hypothetical protein TTHERM_01398500 (macronuclear) [Tetrahymena thermophila SB210]|uniref:Uncharacterized protein n=1 Tax=Tetrahymena thermophila (strain SB210) TaxID=312017 RepID=Q229I5_TETTS|nr:hypothetical protein TTHERM_01398500 [Tetrahymena thermophila SB210]EAR81953.1 hypothetical protein TTHERM_01398500 [Tetrahymena thermophila SB210]|eukprot:XP_001029616.1 hypothetical protein TTHERM_01398500 [Tetrahymena thermophila SB210]
MEIFLMCFQNRYYLVEIAKNISTNKLEYPINFILMRPFNLFQYFIFDLTKENIIFLIKQIESGKLQSTKIIN